MVNQTLNRLTRQNASTNLIDLTEEQTEEVLHDSLEENISTIVFLRNMIDDLISENNRLQAINRRYMDQIRHVHQLGS